MLDYSVIFVCYHSKRIRYNMVFMRTRVILIGKMLSLLQFEHLNLIFLLEFVNELRHYVVEITNDAKVGGLENGGVFVLVYGRDHLGVAEAREMLDLARNAEAQVKVRFYGNAGESYAALFGQPVKFLGNRPCAADFAAQDIG